MKIFITLFFLLIAVVNAAEEVASARGIANTYEQAQIPDFLPHVGKALPGRCYHTDGSSKRIASVLMVSFETNGFEVAPFDAEKKREDIFDDLSYEDILKHFPLIKKEFMVVSETANGAVIESLNGTNYKGEIRESEKFMILRVFINDKILKFCNYKK